MVHHHRCLSDRDPRATLLVERDLRNGAATKPSARNEVALDRDESNRIGQNSIPVQKARHSSIEAHSVVLSVTGSTAATIFDAAIE